MAQHGIDFLELLLAQSPGPPGSFAFQQPSQAHLLELVHPVLHRPGCITQQLACLRTCHALRYQQYAVQSMVIARFFRAADLILQSENHGGGVRDAKWSHSSMRSQVGIMRNYL